MFFVFYYNGKNQKRKWSAEKKVGLTEHPTKIFADQVTAKIINQFYILLSFDSVRALETHDVTRATSCIACALEMRSSNGREPTSFPGSLFSASLGRWKTLVAAGHVTTQNPGAKQICWIGGVAEYFLCWCDKLCGKQIRIIYQSLKTTRSIAVRSRICRLRMLNDFCRF